MKSLRPKRSMRRGFSLLEVLLATAILLGSVVVLGELSRLALRNATAARSHSRGAELCDRTLAEIVAGIRSAAASSEQPFEDDPAWLYAIEILPCETPGVSCVEVVCRQDLPQNRRPVEVRLVRLVRGGAAASGLPTTSHAGQGSGVPANRSSSTLDRLP